MRSDLLSKRIFIAGCFGLPWLWTVHCLYHWKGGVCAPAVVETDGETDDTTNPDDHFASDASGLPVMTPEEIQQQVKIWVGRCRTGSILAWTLVVAWIVTAQVLRVQDSSILPTGWYMINADDASLTGW